MTSMVDFSKIEDSLREKHRYTEEDIEKIMPKLEEIDRLRREKNAVLLAHYYQIAPIQLIADVAGDSLKLAESARELKDKDLVVSSTVVFMAEMVKLLSPEKKVVVPSLEASCSIAEGINADALDRIRKEFPNSKIVSYINTYAATKAKVDVVCTSANAEEVLRNIEGERVVFVPDYFFAKNIIKGLLDKRDDGREYLAYKRKDGNDLVLEDVRTGIEKVVKGEGRALKILDKGTCVVHEGFTAEHVRYYRAKEGAEIVIAHPEVNPEVAAISDFVGGTGKMIEYVGKSKAQRIMVVTECDLIAPLREAYPEREFITPCLLCPYMKKNSLDGVIKSFRDEVYEINIDPSVAEGARRSLQRMFELTGGRK